LTWARASADVAAGPIVLGPGCVIAATSSPSISSIPTLAIVSMIARCGRRPEGRPETAAFGASAALAHYPALESGMAGKPSRRRRGDRRQIHVLITS
jgi:hypothetical protein